MTTPLARVLESGIRNAVIHMTAEFDSSADLTNYKPFSLSLFGAYPNLGAPTKFAIESIKARTFGVTVTLYWEGTTNEVAAMFQPEFATESNLKAVGGIPNNATGATGEMLLSTLNASVGAKYDILLQVRKVYGNAS